MNEEKFIALLTKGKLQRMNWEIMALSFFELYMVYIWKKSEQFFFHTDSLNCLKKDSSVLLKVINI